MVDGEEGKAVVVGVKLDSLTRELLTWALVNASNFGDRVIALHVIDPTDTIDKTTSSLVSLVNKFDSVLSVYQGFCNLKQVDLKLKVCRGKSVRKALVREAQLHHPSATVVVGVSKTRRGIRSPSISVAKYCAKKLPCSYSVFAVDNGRVVFNRETLTDRLGFKDRQNGNEKNCERFQKNRSYLSDSGSNKPKCRHRIRKSCSKCRNKIVKEDCFVSDTCSVSGTSVAFSDDESVVVDDFEDNSLAIVPVQSDQPSLNHLELEVCDSRQLKPGWSILRRLLQKRQRTEKPVANSSVLIRVSKLSRLHYSVIYPDQKQQSVSYQDEFTLDEESGAIVQFGYSMASPIGSLKNGFKSLPKELLGLNEKFSDKCRLFSFQELLEATSNFIPEKLVGRGGSGCVYRGNYPNGKEFAVKVLKASEDSIIEFVQEIDIITALDHKNIVSLLGFCSEDGNLLLVYDFMSRGSLEENLHGHKKGVNVFGWQQRYRVAVGIAEALYYLHCGCSDPVIHRDVKSSNILLSDDFEPQLSDFGLASWASSSSHIICTNVTGTFGYLAPEYLMHGKVSDKVDVYAFGVVLLELLSGRKPINRDCPKEQESLVMWAKPILKSGDITQMLDPNLGNNKTDQENIEKLVLAATLCIRHTPRLRPSISIILNLLHGDEEVMRWARQQESASSEDQAESDDGGPFYTDIQSHLNLALLDIDDDSSSISSERSLSIDEYLRGRWSRTSSFD